MKRIILFGILFLIVYAFKKEKRHEKAPRHNPKYMDDEWEDVIPDFGQPERSFSIELLSRQNHPIVQKLEAFSNN